MMSSKPSQLLEEVLSFVDKAAGLSSVVTDSGVVSIKQNLDGKIFRFQSEDLIDVLPRVDGDGKEFIQVNFTSGTKVLFTTRWLGSNHEKLLVWTWPKFQRL